MPRRRLLVLLAAGAVVQSSAYDPSPLYHAKDAKSRVVTCPNNTPSSTSAAAATNSTKSVVVADLTLKDKKNHNNHNDSGKVSKRRKNVSFSSGTSRKTAQTKRRSPEEAASLRRIQSEWRDMVSAGMAFNWKLQKPVLPKGQEPTDDASITPHHIWVGPVSKNLWVWHFSFQGIPGTPFEGGVYHGRLVLPKNYPSSPPKVQVVTPSGRFIPGADICLSASHFHPETWTATWTVRTLVESLRLHMITTANEIGGMEASYQTRVEMAKDSRSWKLVLGSSSSRPILVDHARMVQMGLFPSSANSSSKAIEGGGYLTEVVESEMDAIEQKQTLESDGDDMLNDHVVPARSLADDDSPDRKMHEPVLLQYLQARPQYGFLALFKSPLKVVLLGLCILFVVLNTT